MDQFQIAEYAEQVMAATKLIHQALGATEFDVATDALITVLAEHGKQSALPTEEFLIVIAVQIKRLMDRMTATEHTVQ